MEKKLSEKIAIFTAPAILMIILGAHFFLPANVLERKVYAPTYVLAVLNIVFLGFTSLLISYIAARSYIRSGALSILLLGSGALMFGAASITSEWFLYVGGGVNIADTIDVSSALLTGGFYFAATLSVLVDWPREMDAFRRQKKLRICYASVVLLEALIVLAAFQGMFPTFYMNGPSVLRQMLAGASSALLFIAGLHILLFYIVNRTDFLFWYALALMIIAQGFLCAILQRSDLGLIGWTGRLAQYLGGLYLLVAASVVVRQRPLEHVLAELLNKPRALYASVFENSMEGIVLSLARGTLLAANPQALSMLGYAPHEVPHLNLKDLLKSEDPDVSAFLRARARGNRFRGELPMVRKDGSSFPVEITSSTFEDHQGTLMKAILFRDITLRKQSQQALRQAYAQNERNLAQLRAIFNQMTDGLVTFDPDGNLSQINQAALNIYGFESDDGIKGHLNQMTEFLEIFDLDGNKLPPDQWPIGRALRGETFTSVEVHGRRRDIDKTWIASYGGTPVYDSDGKMLLAQVCVRDITDQKRMQAALRETQARLMGFFKASSVYMAVLELTEDDFIYLMPNQKAADFFKLPLERVTGMTGRQLGLPEEVVSEGVQILRQCEKSADPITFEYILPYEDAEYCFLVTVSHIPLQNFDAHPRFAVTAFDITPRRQAEEQIKQSLKEKETLLQEIHHRVKNNMQVIISLLNLQSSTVQDEKVKSLLKESSSRVNAMALIHNYLYQSASLSEIDLNQYFESLAGSLISMYKASRVSIEVSADHIKLSMDQAIPCGLIINELISNALKHAFPGNKAGRITIEARQVDKDHYLLNISDNGVGLPDAVYHGKMESLGLKLVRGLAENQLGGRMSVTRDQGTHFTIEIPVEM
ncbi:MAG: PAS domain S-box protein [Desulfobacteraceae bacterium]|nr:MAG: PAS domain S-box protein [Desulfobacteraceae bacterium]